MYKSEDFNLIFTKSINFLTPILFGNFVIIFNNDEDWI